MDLGRHAAYQIKALAKEKPNSNLDVHISRPTGFMVPQNRISGAEKPVFAVSAML